jgi:ATP-dependent DNA helicase RecQ
LRQLRKELSDREGLPAYAIFNNEQLAEMVRRQVTTIESLRKIPGVGEGRVEKYGTAFLSCLREISANQRSDAPGGTA